MSRREGPNEYPPTYVARVYGSSRPVSGRAGEWVLPFAWPTALITTSAKGAESATIVSVAAARGRRGFASRPKDAHLKETAKYSGPMLCVSMIAVAVR